MFTAAAVEVIANLGACHVASTSQEQGGVKDAIAHFNLTEPHPNSRMIYAHCNKPETFGYHLWHVFEFETNATQAYEWVAQAKARQEHHQR